MNLPADGANGGLLPSSSVDRSIGFLVVGLVAIVFFILTFAGLSRVQDMTRKSATSPAATERATHAEIVGDPVEPAPNN